MKLSRTSRLIRILTMLQSARHYSAGQLADILGISKRTVYRDLNELEAAGIPYQFDTLVGGYAIEPEYFLPSVDFNMQEALALLMLIQKTSGHLPLPFKNAALMAGLKIENNLPAELKRYCNATLENVSIRPDSHAPMEMLDKVFAKLQMAIRKKRKVKLHYASVFDGKDISTTLSPYHLTYNNRAWYIIGHSSVHKEMRTFKLNRIKKLNVLDKCFVVDKKFEYQDYFGKAWSMIPEGKLYHVKLKFTKRVARNVAEVTWHSSQKTTRHSDRSVTLEFVVDGIGEIGWWILGYGDQVEVITPKKLRSKIAKKAKNMAKINS
ncbi:MAG: YafY family transcriptional regulator [Planctomycetes bacterium]|nr:YafY family transcriptional regulator [Planctomycetota bacterium]